MSVTDLLFNIAELAACVLIVWLLTREGPSQ
jgi:hypothetical protein